MKKKFLYQLYDNFVTYHNQKIIKSFIFIIFCINFCLFCLCIISKLKNLKSKLLTWFINFVKLNNNKNAKRRF